jgi:hypothetical protein
MMDFHPSTTIKEKINKNECFYQMKIKKDG